MKLYKMFKKALKSFFKKKKYGWKDLVEKIIQF